MGIDRRRFMTLCGVNFAGILLSSSVIHPYLTVYKSKAETAKRKIILFMFDNMNGRVCVFDLLNDPTATIEYTSALKSHAHFLGAFRYPYIVEKARDTAEVWDNDKLEWNKKIFFERLDMPLSRSAMAIMMFGNAKLLDLTAFDKLSCIVKSSGALVVAMVPEPTYPSTARGRKTIKSRLKKIRNLADLTLLVHPG